jgi:hypothetical protein
MKLVNKTGYLKGAKTAKNPVNIIPSNLITTQGMAFPIKANGKTLYPNTGQYKFPTSHVVETPLKKKNGDRKLTAPKVRNPTDKTKVSIQKPSMKSSEYVPSIENKVDEYLGYPSLAARNASNLFPGEDPQDNVRHALAGMYTAEAIKNKTGNIPLLSKALGFAGSTGLGIAHEAKTFFKDNRSFKTKAKEAAEDIYNNAYGAYKGAYGKHGVLGKKTQVINKALMNELPDGMGEERPFIDNPNWTDPYNDRKKKDGSKLIKYKEGSKGVSLAFSRGEKDPKGGLTQKGVDKYNRATGGNLKMAVTTPPSKLKAGSKDANRRKSFCARMGGMPGPMTKPNGEPSRKALALRKWNC